MSRERSGQITGAKAIQEGQDTRRVILDAAVALFEKTGYQGFSLRQVAKATGYTPTTIYLYFEDKDDLLFHVVMEGFRNFGSRMKDAYASADAPDARLIALGEAYIRFGLENPLHYRLMFMERGEFLRRRPPEGFEAPIDSFALLLQGVTECIESGIFKPGDPMVYATAIWSTVHGLVALNLTNPVIAHDALPTIKKVAIDMVLKGLGK